MKWRTKDEPLGQGGRQRFGTPHQERPWLKVGGTSMVRYLVKLSKNTNGTILVDVPDIPEAHTCGDDEAEALMPAISGGRITIDIRVEWLVGGGAGGFACPLARSAQRTRRASPSRRQTNCLPRRVAQASVPVRSNSRRFADESCRSPLSCRTPRQLCARHSTLASGCRSA